MRRFSRSPLPPQGPTHTDEVLRPALRERLEAQGFRFVGPVEAFGADLSIVGLPLLDLEAILKEGSTALNFPFLCYIYNKKSDDTEERTLTLHVSKYPRHKYGPPPSNDTCREACTWLSQALGREQALEQFGNSTKDAIRVVIGLNIGYSDLLSPDAEAVLKELAKARDCTVEDGHILAVRPDREPYMESAQIITTTTPYLPRLCETAILLGQERFSLEFLGHGQTFAVETSLVTEPDPIL